MHGENPEFILIIFRENKTYPWFNISGNLQVSESYQVDQQNVSPVVSATHVCLCAQVACNCET